MFQPVSLSGVSGMNIDPDFATQGRQSGVTVSTLPQ
jgi:hypothetical protein